MYKALLVGVDEYVADPTGFPDLNSPGADVQLLQRALCDPEWGLFERGGVKLLMNPLKAEFEDECGRFFYDTSPEDVLLFYFSGHGERYNGELRFCFPDTVSNRLAVTSTGQSFLKDLEKVSRARFVSVILDCCHSGLYKGGFHELVEDPGFFYLSSVPHVESPDSDHPGEPTEFTKALSRALTGGASVEEKSCISFNSVANYVYSRVKTSRSKTDQGKELFLACAFGSSHEIIHTREKSFHQLPSVAYKGSASGEKEPKYFLEEEKIELKFPNLGEAAKAFSSRVEDNRFLRLLLKGQSPEVWDVSYFILRVTTVFEDRSEEKVKFSGPVPGGMFPYSGNVKSAFLPVDVPSRRWESLADWFALKRGSVSREDCLDCQGEGRQGCLSCDGDGWIKCSYKEVKCPHCRGKGKLETAQGQPLECPVCRASGEVPCPKCGGSGRLVCGRCDGVSKVDCSACDGHGYYSSYIRGLVERKVFVKHIASFLGNAPGGEGLERVENFFLNELLRRESPILPPAGAVDVEFLSSLGVGYIADGLVLPKGEGKRSKLEYFFLPVVRIGYDVNFSKSAYFHQGEIFLVEERDFSVRAIRFGFYITAVLKIHFSRLKLSSLLFVRLCGL